MQCWIDKCKSWKSDFDKRNEEYYIEAFRKLDQGIDSWNWGSFFMGWAWSAYRKAYALTVKILLVLAFINILARFILINTNCCDVSNVWSRTIITFVAFQILYMCFMGYFGNRLYYNSLKKKIPIGYHTMDDFYPVAYVFLFIGMASFFADLFMAAYLLIFIFYRIDLSAYRVYVQEHGLLVEDLKVNEKNIRRYLDSSKVVSFKHKIASCLVLFFGLTITLISYESIAKTYITIADRVLESKNLRSIDKNSQKKIESPDAEKIKNVPNIEPDSKTQKLEKRD